MSYTHTGIMVKNVLLVPNLYRQLFKQKLQTGFRALSTESDVLFETVHNAGVITLNRTKALNSLTLSMAEKIYPTLKHWEKERKLVMMKGASGCRAFSVGGDVLNVTKSNMEGKRYGYDVAKLWYALFGIVGTYKIPYIALIDGMVMGAALGISAQGSYRIATERTLFQMPETSVGISPDGGATHFFPRLAGKQGLYLTLLAHQLKGSDVLKAGIATHCINSQHLKDVENALVQCKDEQDINSVLEKFSVSDNKDYTLKPHLENIDKCFGAETVEEIIENLKMDGSSWAQDTLKRLEKLCPTSLKVTLKAMQLGSKMSLLDCLKMEYRITTNTFLSKSYYEGVRAILVDRDRKPKWDPPTLADVTDKYVDSHFLLLPGEEDVIHEER